MSMIKTKDILSLKELSTEEILFLLAKAKELKDAYRRGEVFQPLKGKTIALIFEKPSTRTRVSFEVATAHLGASAVVLMTSDLQLSRGETWEDTARVFSRYVDAIVIRTYQQKTVELLAKWSSVPVINALTDDYHPCQILADLLTIYEHYGFFSGLKLAYLGDGNNVAQTLLIGCAKVGINIAVATPKGYEPDKEIARVAEQIAGRKAKVEILSEPEEAVKGADIVYTDVWISMGDEKNEREIKKIFQKFQVNQKLLTKSKSSAIFMHCLPAHRGQEVTQEVIEGKQSVVWEQAENRLHLQKALLVSLVR